VSSSKLLSSPPPPASSPAADRDPLQPVTPKPRLTPATEPLRQLQALDGCIGAAFFDAAGVCLATTTREGIDLVNVGSLASSTLLNAQRASSEIGAGRARLVHVEADGGHILAASLNQGGHPIANGAGRVQLHVVILLRPPCNLGMAKIAAIRALQQAARIIS
jgi:predicted regulator of Ras-like GTPase activity (Roadblock/LC7/MglB family)